MNAIAALWFGVLTSLIVWLLDDTLQEKKKEKILSDFAFYHSSITNKHKEKQWLL